MLKTKDGYAKVIGTSYQGSSDYVLLSNGGSKAISSLSVNYANSAGSATKLVTARKIWGQSFNGTADVNGTIYINNGDSENGAIILNNNVNTNARISAIQDNVVFNTGGAIRFGDLDWDYSKWAGLKYDYLTKTIYLGIADGSIFTTYEGVQNGGTLNLRANINHIDLNSGTSIRGLGNGTPYNSSITLNDASMSLSTYGNITMNTNFSSVTLGQDGFSVRAGKDVNISTGSIFNVSANDINLICRGGSMTVSQTGPSEYTWIFNNNIKTTGQIIREGSSQTWVNGRKGALLRETSVSGYHTLWSLKTTDGSWDFGEFNAGSDWNNIPVLTYITDTDFNNGKNASTYQIKFPLASGTVALTSNILNPTDYYWANIKVSASSNNQTKPSVNTIYANNWFRSQGDTGWYSESYGGGIYMTDTDWIRTFGNKPFYCNKQIYSSDSIRMGDIYLERTHEINSASILFINARTSSDILLCNGGGNVIIGSTTISPDYKLDINGDVHSSGTINCNALNVGSTLSIKDSVINCSASNISIKSKESGSLMIGSQEVIRYDSNYIGLNKKVSFSQGLSLWTNTPSFIQDTYTTDDVTVLIGTIIQSSSFYFRPANDGQLLFLKIKKQSNNYFWCTAEDCAVVKANGFDEHLSRNMTKDYFGDGLARIFIYIQLDARWYEFLCS